MERGFLFSNDGMSGIFSAVRMIPVFRTAGIIRTCNRNSGEPAAGSYMYAGISGIFQYDKEMAYSFCGNSCCGNSSVQHVLTVQENDSVNSESNMAEFTAREYKHSKTPKHDIQMSGSL